MHRILTLLITTLLLPIVSGAQNIDLATVPNRDSVQLTIYNGEDLTLVRETRVMTFAKGVNTLKFSWANTLIDPTSVKLVFLSEQDRLTTIDTVYPHERHQELNWRIDSEIDGEAKVEISYFTSGITWAADYTVTVSPDQTKAHVLSYVTVTNNSGEDYADAQVRLVVGKINLTERIAELARRGWQPALPVPAALDHTQRDSFRRRARRNEAMGRVLSLGEERVREAPQIVREGLSEYFIFTIEGTQSVPNQWAKKMLSFEASDAPVKVEYRLWPQQYGSQLSKLLLLTNDKASGMGDAPLPNGSVQCYQENGRNGLSYLGKTNTNYIAISDKFELNLGHDPAVSVAWTPLQVQRRNIWATINRKKIRQLDGKGKTTKDNNGQVIGWTQDTLNRQTIYNDTDAPVTVSIRRPLPGHTAIQSQAPMTRHDANTVQLVTTVKAGEEIDQTFLVTQEHGRNAKQNKLEIKAGRAVFGD